MASSDDREKRALKELKEIVQEAISNNQLIHDVVVSEEAKTPLLARHAHRGTISIFGVPLLGDADERADVIPFKFLQDKNFKVRDSFETIKNTLRWRREFGVNDDDYSSEGNNLLIASGKDRERRPVCYNALHNNLLCVTFNSFREEGSRVLTRKRFIRSWILSVERSIRELIDFRPGRVNAVLQVHDLDKCSRSWLQELNDHLIPLLEEFYPQSIAKQVFINTPWIHRVCTMWSKFQFVGPSKTAHTLSKYISPEQLSIPYVRDEPKIDESNDQENIRQLAVLFSYPSESKRRALIKLRKLVAGEILLVLPM